MTDMSLHPVRKYRNFIIPYFILSACLFLLSYAVTAFADLDASPYSGMVISHVTLDFPSDIKTDSIKELIKTKQGIPFSMNDADETIRLIYSTNQCSNVALGITTADSRIFLTYKCEPIIVVSKMEFYGVKSVPVKDLEHAVYVQPGTPFYSSSLNTIKEQVIRFYNDVGFMTVNVKVSFEQTSRDSVTLRADVEEGRPAIVKSIKFTGEPEIESSALSAQISIKPQERLIRSTVDNVIGTLETYYHSQGYWQVSLRRPEIIYSANFEEAYINIDIHAGPLYVFEFIGAKHISHEELLDIMGIKKSGGYLNFEIYKIRLENYFKDKGYYFCTVDYSVLKKKRIHVIYNFHEGKKIFIAGIFFSGNRHISSSAIKAQILTMPWRLYSYIYNYRYNGVLSPQRFENDMKAIIYLYKINGFLNVKISTIKIDFVDQRKEWINLTIVMQEGDQTTVNSVSVNGVSEKMNKPVMSMIDQIRINGPFNLWQVQDIKRDIEQFYFSHGYINAAVEYDYRINKTNAEVAFRVKEGARIYIGKVIIAGNIKTATWVIEKNLDFKTGMYFIPDNIIQSRINLLKTGYFENVDIKPVPDSNHRNTVDIDVIVKERKTRGVAVSVGYGTVEGYRGAVDLYDNNILGTARSLDFHIGGGVQPAVYEFRKMFNFNNYITNERDLDLGYKENYIFNTDITGSIDLIDSYVKNLVVRYGLKTRSVVVGLNRNISQALKLSLQYDFEIREPMDVQPGAVLGPADVQPRQLGIISPIIFIDERNNPFNPTNGYFQILRLDWAKHWFISQEEYLKLYTAATKYVPVSNGVTYVLSLRGGYTWPLGTTVALPIEKRFYLGGGSTIRGFVEDTVGPIGADNTPIGGDILLNYQTEFRINLIDSFDWVVFTDGGNVWSAPGSFELKGMHDIRKTAGVGIRYVTPAGALNLDVGFKLDRRTGESPTALNFYIGTVL